VIFWLLVGISATYFVLGVWGWTKYYNLKDMNALLEAIAASERASLFAAQHKIETQQRVIEGLEDRLVQSNWKEDRFYPDPRTSVSHGS
jgi:hypothetical protein